MSRRFGMLLLGMSLALEACRSSRPAPGPPAPESAGTGTSAPPNPAAVPPASVVTPVARESSAAMPAPSAPRNAQDPSSSSPLPAASVPPQPAPATVGFRPHQDIVKLKQAGFSDEFLLSKIRTDNVNYQLTTSEILELRAAGVSETVVEAMLRSGQSP